MKRLLLICYYFPPLGGAGINRPLALYKHLPAYGWQVDVLTVKPVTYRMYEPHLLDTIDTTHIYRAGSRDPQRLMWLLGMRRVKPAAIERARPAAHRFFPDSKIGWLRPAARLGRTLVANQRYDAIVSTSPPITCHLVARQLARETRLPWLADFRDFWTGRKPADWFDNRNMVIRAEKLLAEINQQATARVTVNQIVARFLDTPHIIPNAVDTDFARHWQKPDPNHFVIGLLGTFNDMFPIAPLLDALHHLRRNQPDLFQHVRLLHAGDIDSNWMRPQLERAALADRMTSLGFVPRPETFTKLSAACVLYVALAHQMDLGITTARAYDMIASGRPILACLPGEGELSRLLDTIPRAFICTPEQPSRAAAWLTEQIQRHQRAELTTHLDPAEIAPYASPTLAERFARLLDELTGRGEAT
jgi:glycosyltransferase involved in cell wall biosynthesis